MADISFSSRVKSITTEWFYILRTMSLLQTLANPPLNKLPTNTIYSPLNIIIMLVLDRDKGVKHVHKIHIKINDHSCYSFIDPQTHQSGSGSLIFPIYSCTRYMSMDLTCTQPFMCTLYNQVWTQKYSENMS